MTYLLWLEPQKGGARSMRIKDLHNCTYFNALDDSTLCELLHPANEPGDLALRCSIAHAILKPGETTRQHRLKTAAEVYYILEGEGIMNIDDESAPVHSGLAVYIPPNAKQHIQNTGKSDLKLLCIVDPMWRRNDEELG
jgi:mannose-6-phosphate isomerase-like protein (cupin superfamily)